MMVNHKLKDFSEIMGIEIEKMASKALLPFFKNAHNSTLLPSEGNSYSERLKLKRDTLHKCQ